MTKSARGEFYKIYQDCKTRWEAGVATQYDEVMVKLWQHVAEIEKRLCEIELERDLFWTKDLTKEEQQRVINSILSKEKIDE